MRRETFRTAVIASVLAFRAQGRIVPERLRDPVRAIGHRAMAWLDARRERRERDDEG